MDPAFLKLDVYGRATCPMLWILASSHHEGLIPFVLEDLAVVLRVSESDCQKGIKALLDKGLFQIVEVDASTLQADASNLQADASTLQAFVRKTVARGEERREEGETELEESRVEGECSELEASSKPYADFGEPPIIFPTKGKVSEWVLPNGLFYEIEITFKDAPVLDWIKQARLWTIANPTNQKTARGMPSFLIGWVTRQNDRPAQSRTYQTNGKSKPTNLQEVLAKMPAGFVMPGEQKL
jgi:hypothetical protein